MKTPRDLVLSFTAISSSVRSSIFSLASALCTTFTPYSYTLRYEK